MFSINQLRCKQNIIFYTVYLLDNEANFYLSGGKIAEHASRHLHACIINRPEYKENKIAEAMKKVIVEYFPLPKSFSNRKIQFSSVIYLSRVLWN